MFPVVIYFPKNSFLKKEFNKKLLRFEEFGLIQHWSSAFVDIKYLNFAPKSTGPKKLSLHHLSGTVQMFLGGLAASTVLFTVEMFWFNFHKLRFLRCLFHS